MEHFAPLEGGKLPIPTGELIWWAGRYPPEQYRDAWLWSPAGEEMATHMRETIEGAYTATRIGPDKHYLEIRLGGFEKWAGVDPSGTVILKKGRIVSVRNNEENVDRLLRWASTVQFFDKTPMITDNLAGWIFKQLSGELRPNMSVVGYVPSCGAVTTQLVSRWGRYVVHPRAGNSLAEGCVPLPRARKIIYGGERVVSCGDVVLSALLLHAASGDWNGLVTFGQSVIDLTTPARALSAALIVRQVWRGWCQTTKHATAGLPGVEEKYRTVPSYTARGPMRARKGHLVITPERMPEWPAGVTWLWMAPAIAMWEQTHHRRHPLAQHGDIWSFEVKQPRLLTPEEVVTWGEEFLPSETPYDSFTEIAPRRYNRGYEKRRHRAKGKE